MGEQNGPLVADPFMKVNGSCGCLCLEIGCSGAKAKPVAKVDITQSCDLAMRLTEQVFLVSFWESGQVALRVILEYRDKSTLGTFWKELDTSRRCSRHSEIITLRLSVSFKHAIPLGAFFR